MEQIAGTIFYDYDYDFYEFSTVCSTNFVKLEIVEIDAEMMYPVTLSFTAVMYVTSYCLKTSHVFQIFQTCFEWLIY